MNKYFVYVMWVLGLVLTASQLVAVQRTFERDFRDQQGQVLRAVGSDAKLTKMISLLTLVCDANPAPGSSIAQEVYYRSGMSSNYWDKNLFGLIREQFEQVMAAGDGDPGLVTQLQPLVDHIVDIFDPIITEALTVPVASMGDDVCCASRLMATSKDSAGCVEVSYAPKRLPAEFEEESGSSASEPVDLEHVELVMQRLDPSDRGVTGYGRSKEVVTYKSQTISLKKNRSGIPMQDTMDEKAFDLALQWIGWMYARAGWDISTSSRLAASIKPLSAPALAAWIHGNTFTLSLKATAMKIFDELLPFLDWLQAAMMVELTAARTAMAAASVTMESDMIRLGARKNAMSMMRGAAARIHAVLPTIVLDGDA